MVGVYVNTAFNYYSSGEFNGCPSNAANYINHALLLYGWDSSGNWLLQNQWGTSWGISGKMIISSSLDCGLSQLVGFVSVDNRNTNVQVTMDPQYPLLGSLPQACILGLLLFLLLVI